MKFSDENNFNLTPEGGLWLNVPSICVDKIWWVAKLVVWLTWDLNVAKLVVWLTCDLNVAKLVVWLTCDLKDHLLLRIKKEIFVLLWGWC